MPKSQDIDKLDNLPLRERNHDYSWENDTYWGKDLPYNRLMRWIESQKGKHIDEVITKFLKLVWMPKHHRNLDTLRRHIEFNTYMEDGKVCYYTNFRSIFLSREHTLVENGVSRCVYIHPKTRLICVYKPPTRESWQKRHQRKLDARVRILGAFWQLYKLDGHWFEVKAKNLTVASTLKPDSIILETVRGVPPTFICSKRQLSSKELKKYGLENDKVKV